MDVWARYLVAAVCLIVGVIGFVERIPVPMIPMSERKQIAGMLLFGAAVFFIWALGGPNAK